MDSSRRPPPIVIPADTLSPPTTPSIDKTILRSSYSSGMGLPSLALPHLTFSSSLRLTSINPAAMTLFFGGGGTGMGSHASWFLTKSGGNENDGSSGEDENSNLDLLRETLMEAAACSQTAARLGSTKRRWDDYTTLTYWTGCNGARFAHNCEVIVQTFVPQHNSRIDSPLAPPSDSATFVKLAPTSKTPPTAEPSFSVTFIRDLSPLVHSPPPSLRHPTRTLPDPLDLKLSSVARPEDGAETPQDVAREQAVSSTDCLENNDDPMNIQKYFKSTERVVEASAFKEMVENLPQVRSGLSLPYWIDIASRN